MQFVFLKELYINQLVLMNLSYFKNENKYFEVIVFEKRRKLKKKLFARYFNLEHKGLLFLFLFFL